MLRTLAYWHSSLAFRRPYYSNSDHWYHHYGYSLLTIPRVVWSSCISWLMWTLKQFYEIRRAAESSVILWMWATFPDNVSDFLKIVHLVSLASGLKSRFFQSKSIVFTTRLLWLRYYLDIEEAGMALMWKRKYMWGRWSLSLHVWKPILYLGY